LKHFSSFATVRAEIRMLQETLFVTRSIAIPTDVKV
jgi:hypothetical protein